jgi:uncharacterized membrane protein YagU involved in acid resistance
MSRNSASRTILTAGVIAGTIDITYAIGFSAWRGTAPMKLLQSVASGLLGADAFQGGWPVAALGLGLHFLIALIWAALFYAVGGWFPRLRRQAVVAGMIYGAVIYAAMNLVVLPLSRCPFKFAPPPLVLTTGLLVHIFGIGLTIALVTRKLAGVKAGS